MAGPARNRLAIFFLVNVGFALLIAVASAAGGFPNPRLLYLMLLFALCSSPIIDLDRLNGRQALLALFMLVYFVSYGVGDLSDLLAGSDRFGLTSYRADPGFLSQAEAVILVGGVLWTLGFRAALLMVRARRAGQTARDWPKTAILIVGVIFWAVGTIALYRWNVYIIPDTTNAAARKGLASITPLVTLVYLIGQMCQPLGILLLAYALTVYRNRYLKMFFIGVIVLQIFIGFVVDIKGVAMYGLILIIMTRTLVDGKLPKVWLAVGVVFVTLMYPYFTAYRTAIHGGGIARTTVVENFAAILQRTIAAKDKVNSGRERAQTFLERSNVKSSVEVVVLRTGHGVEFQRGHTLSSILGAFMPRIIWSDKQEIVATGQLFNKQFHLFDSDDIYVSPSYLGDLYWNFGWSGVLVGMGLLGLLCGWVGARFSTAEFTTVTAVLVTVITIKQLIVGFEGAIADNFVVWLRSLAVIGVLHLLLARLPVASRSFRSTSSGGEAAGGATSEPPGGGRLFPNLLT